MRIILLVISLNLLTFTTTAPSSPTTTPSFKAKAFHLLAVVTDPSLDLSPSINGWAVTTAHSGAAQNVAIFPSPSSGRLFYENGTTSPGTTNILTDGGTPLVPFGLATQPPPSDAGSTASVATVNVGPGTPITLGPLLTNTQGGWTWLACNEIYLITGT
ncbi:hypothetical protein QBC35DRAFT_494627 [Podospora australis]|uniref:DUF7907 domain-containing protein n=1 Tax=Podospora australis TaxID=1536484 RepID=A0AAN7AK75_9PEZI|nr:hypothetical protein QBC35DRAFT_494627 [Podospora australis]